MKTLLIGLAAAGMLMSTLVLAADDESPAFENGPVWQFSDIQTKDGHFSEYMSWLSSSWKPQEEALKKAGVIIAFKVFLVTDPRQIPEYIHEAFHIATSGRPGPVVIDIPKDVQFAKGAYQGPGAVRHVHTSSRAGSAPKAMAT